MTNILIPDDKFDFDKVHLGQPNAVHGGVFFSKILFGNTADNLFMTQNEAKANYFNQGADYHASTFIDENEFLEDGVTPNPNFGKSLMSKQQMDKDGNITYADIEYEEEVQVENPNYNPDLPISEENKPFPTENVTNNRKQKEDDVN